MKDENHRRGYADKSRLYHIRIKGHLGAQWSDWFGGMTVRLESNGETLLCGPVADQAELHGLLRKVRDLGMPLISVEEIDQVNKNES